MQPGQQISCFGSPVGLKHNPSVPDPRTHFSPSDIVASKVQILPAREMVHVHLPQLPVCSSPGHTHVDCPCCWRPKLSGLTLSDAEQLTTMATKASAKSGASFIRISLGRRPS